MAAEDREARGEGPKKLLAKLAENPNARRIILAVGLAGIALIFLSSLFAGGGEKKQEQAETSSPTVLSAQQYADGLETNLTEILSQIQGAGGVKVLITLERGAEQVYATEEKRSAQGGQDSQNSSTETTTVLVKDADGTQRALKVTELQPVIQGVVVVCDGGGDPVVQQNITNAVTTALHITSVRVCVVKAK